ncbi:MAG: LamG-like jellyroll fold domain-containing protein, partial [Planctomycetota bacterium]
VAVFEAAAIRRIFVDGVLRATNTQSIAVTGNGQGVRIAQRNNADQKFTGSLADVAVFSRALSSQEVSEYDAGPEPIRTVDGSHNISGTDASIIVPTYDSQSNGTVTASWEYRRLSDNAVIQSGTGNATMTGLTPGESYYTFFRGSNNGGHAEAEDQTTAAQQAGSGQAAISGDAGEFVIAGQDAIVLRSHDIASDEGAFSVSGQDINAVRGLSVEAEIGSYLFSGQDSNIARGLVHSPSQAAITLSGQDADFSLQSGLTIAAEQATFTIAGQDAAMIQSLVLVAAGGSFAIAGQDSLIGNQLVIVGDVGSLGLTGQDANLLRQFFEKADTGSFSLAGKEITFEFGGDVTIISESGFFSADGQSASIRFPSQVSTKRIGFRIDGRKVILQGV